MKTLYACLLALAALCLAACLKTTENQAYTENAANAQQPRPALPLFSPELPYELSELRVVVEYPASETNDSLCKGWSLSESQVRALLGAAQPITQQEHHYAFDHLPCEVEGRLSQKGQIYTLRCNGGAWLSISHQDTTLLFGNFGKTLDAYFISPPYADE